MLRAEGEEGQKEGRKEKKTGRKEGRKEGREEGQMEGRKRRRKLGRIGPLGGPVLPYGPHVWHPCFRVNLVYLHSEQVYSSQEHKQDTGSREGLSDFSQVPQLLAEAFSIQEEF